jgi:hypothetical protein
METRDIVEGDRLRLSADATEIRCENLTRSTCMVAPPLAPAVMAIIAAGGLVGFFREHGRFPSPLLP